MQQAQTPPLDRVPPRRSGRSGLHVPALTLGLGRGPHRPVRDLRTLVRAAMDLGVSSFDVTSPSHDRDSLFEEAGQAFQPWGRRRAELVLSARIGQGTYPRALRGYGSRQQIMSGLDTLLQRSSLTYLDVLYVHRNDPGTPLEETVSALADVVRQGKALYAGLSAVSPALLVQAHTLMTEYDAPAASCQVSYSLMDRWAERTVLSTCREQQVGVVACAPLAHGALSPTGQGSSPRRHALLRALTYIAASRGQSVEQLALSWALHDSRVTSALVSTSDPGHLGELHKATCRTAFTPTELAAIDACCPPPAPHSATHPLREEPQ
ncbi:aldo/keto reductase [Streptomyces sp. NPDC051555]|uniref:aldo/keto reductase n=1 Tax=Streptomyces sp. NPDC051555 TaxID=3365657 RepID=UPI0037AC5544